MGDVKTETRLRAHIWSGLFTKQEGNPSKCRAAVPDGGRSPMFHQCRRNPVVFRDCVDPKGHYGFCAQHDPVTVAAKNAERESQWRRKWDERDARIKAQGDRKEATAQCIAVLREIEAGHNDPRTIAREALAKLDAIAEPSTAPQPT